MIRGGKGLNRRAELYVINGGTLNGMRYRDEILEAFINPFARQSGPGFMRTVCRIIPVRHCLSLLGIPSGT